MFFFFRKLKFFLLNLNFQLIWGARGFQLKIQTEKEKNRVFGKKHFPRKFDKKSQFFRLLFFRKFEKNLNFFNGRTLNKGRLPCVRGRLTDHAVGF